MEFLAGNYAPFRLTAKQSLSMVEVVLQRHQVASCCECKQLSACHQMSAADHSPSVITTYEPDHLRLLPDGRMHRPLRRGVASRVVH